MKYEVELQMIGMPNFLTIKMPPRKKEEGFIESVTVSIENLTPEQASEYADNMRAAFLEHWTAKKQEAHK